MCFLGFKYEIYEESMKLEMYRFTLNILTTFAPSEDVIIVYNLQ